MSGRAWRDTDHSPDRVIVYEGALRGEVNVVVDTESAPVVTLSREDAIGLATWILQRAGVSAGEETEE